MIGFVVHVVDVVLADAAAAAAAVVAHVPTPP